LIAGRPTNQVIAAFTALFNVIVLVATGAGVVFFTPELVAAINVAAATLITLIAGQAPTVTAGTQVTVVTPNGDPNRTITA